MIASGRRRVARAHGLWALLVGIGIVGCQQSRRVVLRCTPGERIDVGCGAGGLGSGNGLSRIVLCDAAIAGRECTETQAVTNAATGAVATAFCPSSGALAVGVVQPTSTGRDDAHCVWAARRTPVVENPGALTRIDCAPGALVALGCGCELGRPCTASPTMSVCDGAMPTCSAASAIDTDSSSDCGCPSVEVLCPASGRLAVALAGTNAVCEFGVAARIAGI